jgi:hypothetical protein
VGKGNREELERCQSGGSEFEAKMAKVAVGGPTSPLKSLRPKIHTGRATLKLDCVYLLEIALKMIEYGRASPGVCPDSIHMHTSSHTALSIVCTKSLADIIRLGECNHGNRRKE